MEQKNITLKEIKEMISEKFELLPFANRQDKKSFYCENEDGSISYFFDKRQYDRQEVIHELYEMLWGAVSDEFILEIDGITILWTQVTIKTIAGKTNH